MAQKVPPGPLVQPLQPKPGVLGGTRSYMPVAPDPPSKPQESVVGSRSPNIPTYASQHHVHTVCTRGSHGNAHHAFERAGLDLRLTPHATRVTWQLTRAAQPTVSTLHCAVFIFRTITRMALALGVAPEAVGSGGAATETAGAASTMVAPTAASINGATAANHECKQVSAFMCTPMRLYGRDVHVWAG